MPPLRLLHPYSLDPDIPIPPSCPPNRPLCFPTFPPSPLPPADDSISFEIHPHNNHHLLRTFVIASSSLLSFSLLLLLFLYFFLTYRRRRRNHSPIQPLPQHPPPPHPNPNPNPNGSVNNDGDGDDDTAHHIWFIRTVGLDDSVINAIPVTVYKSSTAVKKDGDCPVCLGEFEDGESVKVLPKCAHPFHQPCIDTWLKSHVSCPLCRAAVVLLDQESSAAHNNQEECVIHVGSGAGPSSGPLDVNDYGGLQPIRRSVSMDASQLGMLMMGAEAEAEAEPEEKREKEVGIVVSKNRGKGLMKGDESFRSEKSKIKRSMSSRSGRLFFTRYERGRGRGRSASVLPM